MSSSDDATMYDANPPTWSEFGSDEESPAWDGDDLEDIA